MTTQPILETERLVLRLPRMQDAETIFRTYAHDPEVCRYVTWKPNQSLEEIRTYMRARLEGIDKGSLFAWVVTYKGDDALLGIIELRLNVYKADFGYVLARQFWGRGIMSVALRAVVNFAFTLPGMYRVWAVCDAENRASARVMEKAGLTCEGMLRRYIIHPNLSDEPRDVYCYALTR